MKIYLFSQLLVVIATIFIGSTYLVKDKKKIMFLCIIYCFLYGYHYLILKALTGFAMTLISAIRNIVFYKNAKKNKNNSIITLVIFTLSAVLLGIFTFQDNFSILSIIASIISTYSIWQKDNKKYRMLAIPVSICFIIYAIHINSLLSIITETLLLGIEIVGVIDYIIRNRKDILILEETYD